MKLFVVLDDAFGIATGASNYLCKDSVKFIIYIRGVLKETIHFPALIDKLHAELVDHSLYSTHKTPVAVYHQNSHKICSGCHHRNINLS